MALLIGADVSGVEIRKDLYELSRRIMRVMIDLLSSISLIYFFLKAFHYMTNQFGFDEREDFSFFFSSSFFFQKSDIGTVDLLPPGDGCAESFRAQFHNLHYFFSNNFLFGPEINLQVIVEGIVFVFIVLISLFQVGTNTCRYIACWCSCCCYFTVKMDAEFIFFLKKIEIFPL